MSHPPACSINPSTFNFLGANSIYTLIQLASRDIFIFSYNWLLTIELISYSSQWGTFVRRSLAVLGDHEIMHACISGLRQMLHHLISAQGRGNYNIQSWGLTVCSEKGSIRERSDA